MLLSTTYGGSVVYRVCPPVFAELPSWLIRLVAELAGHIRYSTTREDTTNSNTSACSVMGNVIVCSLQPIAPVHHQLSGVPPSPAASYRLQSHHSSRTSSTHLQSPTTLPFRLPTSLSFPSPTLPESGQVLGLTSGSSRSTLRHKYDCDREAGL
jgi:hypothetical protein